MSSHQPNLPGTEPPVSALSDNDIEEGSAKSQAELIQIKERLISAVDTYAAKSWQIVDLLLSEIGDPMLATTRAYWVLYNTSSSAATLLEIDISEDEEYCSDAPSGKRIPHSKISKVVSRVVSLVDPPKSLGIHQRSLSAQNAFALSRELQKIRKRSDYMGFEQLSRERAIQLTSQAKDLCNRIWRYVRDHYRD